MDPNGTSQPIPPSIQSPPPTVEWPPQTQTVAEVAATQSPQPVIEKPKEEKKAGRPAGSGAITEEQYQGWLEEMRPYLVKACSLYRAMEKAGLIQHQTSIYEKYRLGDYFAQKIDQYRASFGDTINEFHATEALRIADKQKQGVQLTEEEYQQMEFLAKHHRLSQPFFAQRTETATAKDKDFGKVVEPAEITYVVPTDQSTGTTGQTTTDTVPSNVETAPSVEPTP